jgi:hypothetical protein
MGPQRPVSAALVLTVDALAAPMALAPRQDLRSPDGRDAAAGRGSFSAPEMTVVRVHESPPQPSDSIDWGDAALGAGGLLGLILLGVGGALIVAHRRHTARHSPSHAKVPR